MGKAGLPAGEELGTSWSDVARSQLDTPEGRAALHRLATRMDRLLHEYCKRRYPQHADELKQEFLFVKILSGEVFKKADKDRGKLRDFVRGFFRMWVREWSKKQVRSVRPEVDPRFDASQIPDPSANAESLYERRCVLIRHDAIVDAMRVWYEGQGTPELFEELHAASDRDDIDYEAMGRRLGKKDNSLRQAMLRFRKMYRDLHEDELRRLDASEDDFKEVVQQMFKALE